MRRKTLVIGFCALFLVSSVSAAWTENVGFNDGASAEVDRPLINHVKAFLNAHFKPGYRLLEGPEKPSGNRTG